MKGLRSRQELAQNRALKGLVLEHFDRLLVRAGGGSLLLGIARWTWLLTEPSDYVYSLLTHYQAERVT